MAMKFRYRFGLLANGKAAINVVQRPGECFGWRTVGDKSVYDTDTRHPELEGRKDVEVMDIEAPIVHKPVAAPKAKAKMPEPVVEDEPEEAEEVEEKPKKKKAKKKKTGKKR